MVKIYGFLLLIVCLSTTSHSQARLMNIDQLNERINNGKDTTFIINFWATWCVPCVKELPNFEKLNETNKAGKLKILLVSVDVKSKLQTTVNPFIKKRKIKNEIFLLNETNQQEYINRIDSSWSGSIPATLFIKNGTRKFVEIAFTYNELLTAYKKME